MSHFYHYSTLMLLLLAFQLSYATGGNKKDAVSCEARSYTEALAIGDRSVNISVITSTSEDITNVNTSTEGATGKAMEGHVSELVPIPAAPVVDFSFTGAACPVQFTSSVQGAGTYSYLWDFGDGQTSTEENPAHVFNSPDCGSASLIVSLRVKDSNGISGSRSKPITVQQKPFLSFSDLAFPFGDPFNNCGSASASNPNYTILVGNTSPSAGCIDSYTIDWGDGSAPVGNASFPASHTYTSLGTFDMVITANGNNGCSNEITYVVKNMNNPSVGITSPGTTTNLCAPTDFLAFEIAKWGTNSPGTTYTVDYGDGTPLLIITQEEMKASPYYVAANPSASANFPIPHSYTVPNCPNGPYVVRLVANNSCSSTMATVNNITVLSKTTADFTAPIRACANSGVTFTNTSIPGYNANCSQTSIYTWDFGDGTPPEVTTPGLPGSTRHIYTVPGQYTVKLTTRNICGESSGTRQITIDPTVTGAMTGTGMVSGNMNVCQHAMMPVITFTGANGTAPYRFTYRINNGPIKIETTAQGSSSVTVQVPTGTAGSFTYTLVSVSDDGLAACTQVQTGAVKVVVIAPPSGSISGNETVCMNSASPEITFTGSDGTRPYIFTYNINGGADQSISTNTTSNSVTLAVPTGAAGDFKYNLIGVQDSGAGSCSRTLNVSATVKVNELPATMTLPDYGFCNEEPTSGITFSNTVAGTTYRWTNSHPAIGLAASGTGNIASFTARNTTGFPIVATITVAPSVNGCDGANQSFTITVNPSAVMFSRGAQMICSGENTAEVTLSSPSGAALSWTAVQPAGITGLITSGTNTIPVQTLVNTTGAPITVTYTAMAALPATDPCASTQYTYSVTVNPWPVIQQTFSSEVCSGSAFSVFPENNTDNRIPPGIRYTWSAPVINPAGAVTGASAQATPRTSISQTLVNTTSAAATATYTVTPIASGCAGIPFTIEVIVMPVPTSNPVSDITLCNGEQGPAVLFSGNLAGAVYRWTSDNPSIGIAGSGTGSIAAFTAVNTGNSPVQSEITVTPILTNGNKTCEGTPVQFTITVNPGAQVNSMEDMKVCIGKSLSVGFSTQNTGGNTAYEWTNSNNAIGLSASGSGPLFFVPVNDGNTAISATITVTPVFTNNGVSCQGAPVEFTMIVDPAATVVKPLDQEVCHGYSTDEIRFAGNLPSAVYQWTTDNSSIGLPASGSGDIMPFTAVNNGTEPVVATITVIPVVNGCSGIPVSFTITVNPRPVIAQQPEGSVVCLGERPATLTVVVRGIGIPSHQWYSNTSASTFGGTLIPNATGESYDPPADVAGTVYYYCVITFPNDDCNLLTSEVAGVTIHPNPVISAIDQEISSGETFTVIPTWGHGNIVPPGTTYVWSDPMVSPAGSVLGTSAQEVPQAEISQRLVNTTMQVAMVTYTVIPVSGACTGASFKVTVYVDSPLTPHVTVTPISCFGMNDGSITTSIQGGAPYTGDTPYVILWTGPHGFTSAEASIFNLVPGVYHLRLTDSRGKQFSTDYIITAPGELVLTEDKRDVSCYGEADGHISITINGGTGPYQTVWTKDHAPFASTEDLVQLTPGNYEITVTDANGCAPVNRSWVIAQPEPLVLTLAAKSDIRCFGDSTGYIVVEVTGGVIIESAPGVYGYRYLWRGPDGFTSEDKNLSNIPAGDYNLLVTDGSGCSQSLAVTLSEPSPLAVVMETTPISCYGANNGTIRLDITGGTPPYEANWNNYATGTFQDNLSPGNYTILITDAAQCQISTTVNIPEAPVFRVKPEVKNVSCYGANNGSIALNFETTLKSVIFKWSDNTRSGTTRNNVGPGTYTVYIQGGDLCMINRTFIVTEPLPMEISGKVTDITDCSMVDGGDIDLMVSGGTPPYRYTWSNGADTEDLKNLQAGNYAISVSDSMGCVQMAQYTVKRPVPLEIDVATSIDQDCATDDVKAINTATVSGGVPPYQLRWSSGLVSGQNNEQMETMHSGMVVLTVIDQTGCTAIRSFNLDLPDPGITSQLMDCNAHIFQFNGTSAVESEVITYTWDFGDGTSSNLRNPLHAYSAAGTYMVRLTVARAGSCVSEYNDEVTAAVPPEVGIDKDPRFCPGDSILIYGTGAATYRWNDGTIGDSIWIKREGDYSVTGTSASGCYETYDFKASYFDLIGFTIQNDKEEVSQGANRIRLWSENIPYSNYRWDFGDGYSGHGVEVYHSYEVTDDGYFDIILTVINPNGCEEVTTKRIWKSVAAIANTFTPNSDGINDIFLKGWQIEVFNRNGILMYKGDQGWDGRHNGRLVNNDTYFVIIYDSTRMGAEYKKSYVTVLR